MTNDAPSTETGDRHGVATGVVNQAPTPGPAHKRLEVFIGKWVTQGATIARPDAPVQTILASDIYEWMPGGFFVLHTAYGRFEAQDVGGTEIIGYDSASQTYWSRFYDSQGNQTLSEMTVQGDTWQWRGEHTGCTSVFTDNDKTQTAHHVWSADGEQWAPSMDVTLRKVE